MCITTATDVLSGLSVGGLVKWTLIRKKGFRQRPQLTSSQPFDVSNRVFSLTDGFVPNHNAVYGVPPGAKHRHRRRRRGRRGTGGMGLEGVLAAGLGAGILASVFG